MAKYVQISKETKTKKKIYRINNETKEEKLISVIHNGKTPYITTYIDNFIVDEIKIDGIALPSGISPLGLPTRIISRINNVLKMLDIPVNSFYISTSEETSFVLNNERLDIVFKKSDFEELNKKNELFYRIASSNLNISVKNLLHQKAPSIFPEKPKALNLSKKVFMDNLREGIKKDMTAEDVKKLGEFYLEVSTKFVRKDIKEKLLIDLQDKTKIIALENLMKEYKDLLDEEPAETKWQKFFEKYITILDSRYIKVLDKNNISTYTTKKPDLILLDLYNFIDLYELKKTNTNLLEYDGSHKNYYWHKDIAMVIAQAEKYVRKMTENSSTLIREIKEDSSLVVDIIKPKAIIVAGHSKYLDNDNKINDFKLLRESLKDITFILYDEFYKQLEHFYKQLKKEDK